VLLTQIAESNANYQAKREPQNAW